jgi:hypothetical protein
MLISPCLNWRLAEFVDKVTGFTNFWCAQGEQNGNNNKADNRGTP